MRKLSFRTIIVTSLVVLIGIISSISFYTYNYYLKRMIHDESARNAESENNLLLALDLVKDQFYYNIDEHDGRIIKTLLQRMEAREQVLNSYLYSASGKLLFSLHEDEGDRVPVSLRELTNPGEEISLQSFPLADKPFTRAYFQMNNAPSCHACHPPEQDNLGYVVIDVAMKNTGSSIAFMRRSSMLFSLVMIIVIIAFVILIHYRFVRKSLGNFKQTINEVNNGNLDARLSIPGTKELGQLGENFNSMLDTFQQTQKELMEFHKKELRSNYKLATIGEMSARLAHEIRNPLTGISNAIEIIVKETSDNEMTPIFEEIRRQTQRVNHAITDLLKYARKKDLNFDLNNINEIISPIVFFLENHRGDKDITFRFDPGKDVPLFRFDQMLMEDVLLNLGINAIEAIPGRGSVTFATAYSPGEGRVSIRVTDTGPGIPEENLPRIFHPFFTTRSEGTGLGLAIVKDIIDKHKGEIWAGNNADGGCTFTISLPVESGT